MSFTKPKIAPRKLKGYIPYNEIVALYQEYCGDILPTVKYINNFRKHQIKARCFHELPTLEAWELYFKKVAASDFLMGRGENAWTHCSFDWLIRPRNVVKVLENNYSNYR